MIRIPDAFLQNLKEHAERDYPHECCGLILGSKADPAALSRIEPCPNIQDRMHAQDPRGFSRTAETAYFMDPRFLLAIQKTCRERNEVIRIIYHSHVEAEPLFSPEDEALAVLDREPLHAGVYYLIISVVKREAAKYHLYGWDKGLQAFQRVSAGGWGPAGRRDEPHGRQAENPGC
ncbi:MAG TPA: M67 family metallopeptidase [Verrucomicrobiae bacterium]|jgi:proteasome lid subunit RPN8/RPN11|nr:M67 family metallopeptidase [Verrucomicrobiae bacterium]